MRRTVSLALPLALASGLAVAALVRSVGAAPADPVPAATPGRVAVVDVLDVIQTAPGKTRIEAAYKERKTAIDQFKKDERDRLEKEQGDIELLPKTDAKRPERERALARSMVLSEFDLKAKVADAQKEYFDALENLWREVRAEVRRVAQEAGYTVVLTKTEDELNVRSKEEFVINVAVRNVLYYDAAVDITNVVKARMAARAPGGAPPPPPAAGSPRPGGPPAPSPNPPK